MIPIINRIKQLSKAGFTLVEINMAILVLAGGALVVMGLFPIGLRDSREAKGQMRQTAFAEHFLGAVRAAAQMPNVETEDDLRRELRKIDPKLKLSGTNEDVAHEVYPSKSDRVNRIFYKAWTTQSSTSVPAPANHNDDGKLVLQVVLQATIDNVDQKKKAFDYAPLYSTTVILDAPYTQGKN